VADELPELPADGPATLAGVKAELGITEADTRSDAKLTARVLAVNAKVRTWPCVEPASGAAAWTEAQLGGVVLGANMLVSRLYSRLGSPMGYEQVGGDLAVYVSRNDPDVAMLLGLGSWGDPSSLVG
jgi:hypothetical protein